MLTPPSAFMQETPETQVPMVVNGDMALKIRALRVDLHQCNIDKASLRAWSKDVAHP